VPGSWAPHATMPRVFGARRRSTYGVSKTTTRRSRSLPPWVELGPVLPHAIRVGIELDGGPAARGVRRKPRRDVLPRQPRALRGTVIQEEARGACAQGGEGGHLALGHETLGETDLEPIKTDCEHPPSRHRRYLLSGQSSATAREAKQGASHPRR
jgi:hypothetical protein